MSAQVHPLQRSGFPAPLVPANVDVHAADGCHFDLPELRDSDWIRTLDLAHRGAIGVLHMESMRGKPSGSLPNDDRLLASYLGFSIREVDQFLAMKAKVLHGWVLCSDARLYHPLRAKSVLRLWIGWRETNRRSALGNGARNVEVRRGIREIESDIDAAAEALRVLDPRDKFLDELDARMSKWTTRQRLVEAVPPVTEAVTPVNPTFTEAVDPRNPPLDGSHKLSEAKRSQEDSSSPQSGDDSSDRELFTDYDVDETGGSAKRTPSSGIGRERAPPWPTGYSDRFRARFPKREAWGAAERRLDQIRKAGKVPFDDIMAGVDRLVERVEADLLALQFVPQPGKWLRDRGWEDAPAPPGRVSPRDSPSAARPMSGSDSGVYGFGRGLDGFYGVPPPGPVIDHDDGDDA